MSRYCACVLPCSEAKRYLDRFSILDDDCEGSDGLVPFWPLLEKLLGQEITTWPGLQDILQNISTTMRGSTAAAGDYGMLQAVVEQEPGFFASVLPVIVQSALALPKRFDGAELPKLVSGSPLNLNRGQCASLIAHQFLCSFEDPRADYFDFSVWYDSNQRHPTAVAAYLKAIFAYFRLVADQPSDQLENYKVQYALRALDVDTPTTENESLPESQWPKSQLSPISVVRVEAHSTKFQELEYQGADGAVVISANKDIGFGQSATQEELHVGSTPEACMAVLFTPQLRPNEILSINGAKPMVRFTGQRRNISWEALDATTAGGRMLFMDALEIDMHDADSSDAILPDLIEENILRELRKAYTAFSSWPSSPDSTIKTGLWGCGAFNGEPTVKLVILWAAASLAEKSLQVVLDDAEGQYAVELERFFDRVPRRWSVEDLISHLRRVPKNTTRLQVIQWLNDYDGYR